MEPFLISANSVDEYGRLIRRQRRYRAPTRGVRVPRELSDFETHCDAMILALTDGAVLAEGTAARLWGLPIPTHVDLDRVVAVRPSGAWQSEQRSMCSVES